MLLLDVFHRPLFLVGILERLLANAFVGVSALLLLVMRRKLGFNQIFLRRVERPDLFSFLMLLAHFYVHLFRVSDIAVQEVLCLKLVFLLHVFLKRLDLLRILKLLGISRVFGELNC